jgi:hypothetical protein
MRQFMPKRLDGKLILTNTVTQRDVEDLRDRGVARLVTTTPEFAGRSFGTNVVEALLVALGGSGDDERFLGELGIRPRLVEFTPA